MGGACGMHRGEDINALQGICWKCEGQDCFEELYVSGGMM